MTTGWRCPNCGKVYSPHVMECVPCNKAVDEALGPKDNTSPELTEIEVRLKGLLKETQGFANEASRRFNSIRLFKSCPECGCTHHVDGPCISTLSTTP